MKNKMAVHTTLIVVVHIFLCGIIHAHSLEDKDTIPLDPGIRYGTLSNGITYYVKPTRDTTSQMNAYLLLKAGIAHQDSDQYEIAHILEHVALRGGKNMTMEKAMRSGFSMGEINANPSYDFIQYYCTSIATKKKRNIAFQLFQDIIWGLEFRDELIDSERSVIINEMAIRGAFRSNSLMINLENSMMGRGPNRPDDLVKYLSTFPKGLLLRYYKDWYRPDLMAIVVIGDISNVEEIENEIRDKFSNDNPMKNSRSVITRSNNYRNSTSQFIKQQHPFLSEDSNNQSVYLRLYMRQKKNPKEDGLTVLRNEHKRQLLINMLRNRFDRQQDHYGAAFSVIPKVLVPSTLGIKLEISIGYGSVKKVLQNAIGVLKQLQSEGFSEQEFKKGRDDYLLSLSKTDTTKALYWWTNIRNHFVYERPLPFNKNVLLVDMMTNLSHTTFNEFVKENIKTKPKDLDLIMMHPPGHKVKSNSEQIIRQWVEESNSIAVNSCNSPKIPAELLSSSKVRNLEKSTIKKQTVTVPGISEYRLGNGMRIVLNAQDSISPDKSIIKLHGFTAHGVGCYGKDDYFSALNAVDIVKNSGIGGLNKFELERYLTEKSFKGAVVPYISYGEAGIRSTVTFEDLEIALQLIYLYFTAPNKNRNAYEDWKLKATTSPLIKAINEYDFQTRIRTVLGDSTFLPKGTKALEGISKTDMNRALEIYQDIYSNAKDYTFVFTGDFPEDKVLSLSQKYLGNLPAKESKEKCILPVTRAQFKIPEPRSVVIPSTEFMQEVRIELVYPSKICNTWNWKDMAKLLLLQRLINSSVGLSRFISDEGGSYSMGVGTNVKKDRLFNEVFIRFSCSLADVDQLISQIQQVVQFYKTKTVDKNLFDKNVIHMISKYNSEMNSPSSMSEKIHDYYRYGSNWVSSEEIRTYLKSLSPQDIKRTAHELLKEYPFEFKMMTSKKIQ